MDIDDAAETRRRGPGPRVGGICLSTVRTFQSVFLLSGASDACFLRFPTASTRSKSGRRGVSRSSSFSSSCKLLCQRHVVSGHVYDCSTSSRLAEE